MRAMQLSTPGPLNQPRLALADLPLPQFPARSPAPDLLLRVLACGVCHTDLHLVAGDLPPHRLPLTPGHQVVATVAAVAPGVSGLAVGDRVGVPWLHHTCGVCEYCRRGQENLCERAAFTGWDVPGGYADYLLAHASHVVPLSAAFSDLEAAPLLCAGIVGYRALRLAEVRPGDRVGLFGFGASAHLCLQVARHWGCRVAVFTRSAAHRQLAEALGAEWAGSADNEPGWPLDAAVVFAPAGGLVPVALARLRRGGTLAINAIHMSPLPEMDYNLLYGERTVRSVTNATRADARGFMQVAAEARLKVAVETYPLAEANAALLRLQRGEVQGAAVLVPG